MEVTKKTKVALLAITVIVASLGYVVYQSSPSSQGPSYIYQSQFDQGLMGVLGVSYWVNNPELFSGSATLINGMLQLTTNNRFQVGFGAYWPSPTYLKGDWIPWLPVYWKYHSDTTFVISSFPATLVVENWIAYHSYDSYTAMVWYQGGTLYYSYGNGAGNAVGGTPVTLGTFTLPNEFRVIIDADYKAEIMHINWAGHVFRVYLNVEPIGAIPTPFTHFQITVFGTGTLFIKNLCVEESDQLT
jgi:hypothetical protein